VRGTDLPGGKDQEDPQTRQYAVLSLGRVCVGHPLGEEALGACVGALEAAMRDYAVDRRGDVGSWVREVAMEVIVALLSAQRCGAQPRLPGPSSSTQLVAQLHRLRERAFWLLRGLLLGDSPAPESRVELAYRRVCHGEQYDHLGAAAAIAAARGEDPAGPAWPPAHLDALASALGSVSCPAGGAGGAEVAELGVPEGASGAALARQDERSAAVFDAIVPMLAHEEYRSAVLTGLVVSLGGITESTSRDAKKALLRLLHEDGAGAAEGARIETEGALQSKVCEGLLQIFHRVGTRDKDAEAKRLLVPLLNTLGILLAQDCFPDTLAPALFERALGVARCSRDIGRLRASVAVFVGLLRWAGTRRGALSVLLQLLGYSFPVVRQATARALYIRFLEEEGDLDLREGLRDTSDASPEPGTAQSEPGAFVPPPRDAPSAAVGIVAASVLAEVLELISVTPWGTDDEDVLVKALREVYTRLGVELPTSGQSILAPKKANPERRKLKPEYADLVHENHY